jgi:hypothetical protein
MGNMNVTVIDQNNVTIAVTPTPTQTINIDRGLLGPSGWSGYSGFSGNSTSGYSGYSGAVGQSGYSGIGESGYSGFSGENVSGYSGYSGDSTSGFSGYSGETISGYSGYSGESISGFSGYSGSGISGFSGSGISGYSGSGVSGWSGFSGSGISGYSGSGISGYSGSGISGYSGAVGAGGAIGNWGSFWDTTTQTTTINTPTPITFNSYDVDNTGVSIGSPTSRIVFANSGTYSLTFSIQFTNTSTANGSTQVWLKKNGTNIPDTNSHFDVPDKQGSAFSSEILTVNFVFEITATDYVEIYWDTANASVSLETIAGNGTYPRTPSVIFTATQVMYGQSGYSGFSGSGISGYSGSGISGFSGSGISGYSGSGISGYSGSGISGYSGSGVSGWSGFSGSGISGYSGNGVSGFSGYSGSAGAGTPAGSTTQVQYNDTGAFAGSANLTFNGTTLTAANNASISGLNVGKGTNAVSTNTAFGVTALNAATLSGANNTGIGYQAGLVVTSGTENTFIGYQAGKAFTNGSYNTALGSMAIAQASSGTYNTAIGTSTLFQVSSGTSNTAVGFQACTSGNVSNTTAVGYYANRNTGASNGAYFGYQAGVAASGTTNTFIGYSSGSAVTTGAKNVIIGAYTGTAAPISLTGSNNIVLSDGDANVRLSFNSSGALGIGSTPSYGTSGQVLTSGGSAAAPTWGSSLVSGTSQASTSGTAISFTGIPSWVKRITVMFNGVSTSGTSFVQVQIGSTTYTTSGYVSSTSTNGANGSSTTGFIATVNSGATDVRTGLMTITNISGNIWVMGANIGSTFPNCSTSMGVVTLGGVLDRVQVTTVNGTDTFDAGSINILYE